MRTTKIFFVLLLSIASISTVLAQPNIKKLNNHTLSGSKFLSVFNKNGQTYAYDNAKCYQLKNNNWVDITPKFGTHKIDGIIDGFINDKSMNFVTGDIGFYNYNITTSDKKGVLTSKDNGVSFQFNEFKGIYKEITDFNEYGDTLYAIGYKLNNYDLIYSIDNGINWNKITTLNFDPLYMTSVEGRFFYYQYDNVSELYYSDDRKTVKSISKNGLPTNYYISTANNFLGNNEVLYVSMSVNSTYKVFKFIFSENQWYEIKKDVNNTNDQLPINYVSKNIYSKNGKIFIELDDDNKTVYEQLMNSQTGWTLSESKTYSNIKNNKFYEFQFTNIENNKDILSVRSDFTAKTVPGYSQEIFSTNQTFISTDGKLSIKNIDGIYDNDFNQGIIYDSKLYTCANKEGIIISDIDSSKWKVELPENFYGKLNRSRFIKNDKYLFLSTLNTDFDTATYRYDEVNKWVKILLPVQTQQNDYNEFFLVGNIDKTIYCSDLRASEGYRHFYSEDNGNSWKSISNNLFNSSNSIFDFFDSGSIIYATSYDGVFASSNRGVNWVKIDSGLTELIKSKLIKHNDYIYGIEDEGFKNILFKLKIGENKWEKVEIPVYPNYAGNFNTIGLINNQIVLISSSYNEEAKILYSSNGINWNMSTLSNSANVEFYEVLNNDKESYILTRNGGIYVVSDFNNIVYYSKPSNIMIYPNPANNIISFNKSLNYLLFDIQGKLINSGLNNHIVIDDIKNGIYFLEFDVNGDKYVQKVVIQH